MIKVRGMRPEDEAEMRRIHAAQAIDYKFPELTDMAFCYVVEEDGRIVGASLNRLISETYLFIDPELHPATKWTAIRLGQQAVLAEANRRGIKELVAMIPEGLMLRFCKRLRALKWERQRDGWQLWGRNV